VSADRPERLREAYDRVSRGDVEGLLAVLHEDVVWTEQVVPDKRVYHATTACASGSPT
jgi:ketosteroid isomerase-like protein